MNIPEYFEFVHRTDQSRGRAAAERREIAIYGLAGEIGSLVSAMKKRLLSEDGAVAWNQPSEEITEELGDVLWYCFSLAEVENQRNFDIFANDIELLKLEIGATNERAETIRAALNPDSRVAFLAAAESFPPSINYSVDDYQTLAFKTARTDGRTLLKVCLAVLTQLAAELLRRTLPDIELRLNKNVADRQCNQVLSEVAWHVAAIASVHAVSLSDIIRQNREKVGFRADRSAPTALHDEARQVSQQFPRRFEVAFVRVSANKSRMYFEGRRLGDDLSDNFNQEDGYRFHDVMHLALIANLGWSPVIRGMMRRKRPDVDEVEDGGRAKVVEELVIKAIHSAGERQAATSGMRHTEVPIRLFPDLSSIPFSLVKTIRQWVQGLEVSKNAYWEWESAIYEGCGIFHSLRLHKQGTVQVDLQTRKASFEPLVSPDVTGLTVGLGMAYQEGSDIGILSHAEELRATSSGRVIDTAVAKKALLNALSLPLASCNDLEVDLLATNRLSVKATGNAQDRIWGLGAVDFKVAFAPSTHEGMLCSVMAIADANP